MQTINLTSHFLIAMPAMSDPNFSRTLTFVCEHNERGALGIVVNRPIEVTLASLFRQVEIEAPESPLTMMSDAWRIWFRMLSTVVPEQSDGSKLPAIIRIWSTSSSVSRTPATVPLVADLWSEAMSNAMNASLRRLEGPL